MKHNVVAPSVGESITEVSILKWAKQSGQAVGVGELLLEIESDKATVEIVAEKAGVLEVLKAPGERIPIGAVVGVIDDSAKPTAGASPVQAKSQPTAAVAAGPAVPATGGPTVNTPSPSSVMMPSARKLAAEQGLDPSRVEGTGKGGRVTKGDVIQQSRGAPAVVDRPGDRRVPMTQLRVRIAERLVQAQHTAAILTTFNECDMSAVMALRNKHKEAFKAKHGVALSFMSFFAKATVAALKAIPEVNASIDGRDTVYHDYQDLGIAVGSERGLVVPVVRDAGNLTFLGIEKEIARLAEKARAGKLSIADLSGGTFTISNGGTYGSLMSTPILTPPQAGILGMHKIQERPVAIGGKVEIRPMMYLALSYDHRLIDGKGAVTFLVTLKEHLEQPEKLGFEA